MEISLRTRAACLVSSLPGEGCGWEERAPGSKANPNPIALESDLDLGDQNGTSQLVSYYIGYY